MVEEIAFENGRISNFEGLVTLTLNQVILHTAVHHSSTSTYMPNVIEIKDVLWTDGHLRPTLLGRLRRVDLMNQRQVPMPPRLLRTPAWKWRGPILVLALHKSVSYLLT